MQNNKIDCFLLAAGESSRMFPLNQIMEKSLLPINGKPCIRHIVDKLLKEECNKYIRNIHIRCLDKFEKQFMHEFRDVEDLSILSFEKPYGTYTTWYLGAGDNDDDYPVTEWCMVHYADCMTDIDYTDFISKIDDRYDGLIAVTNTVQHDYSEVIFSENMKRVDVFREKPQIHTYTWSGIGLFKTMALEKFRTDDGSQQDFAFDIFPQMIKQNKLKAYPYHGFWYDMGNLNSYRKVCALYE